MLVPYPPGIPLIMPGERITPTTKSIQDYLLYAREFDRRFPGFETDIHGLRFEPRPERAALSGRLHRQGERPVMPRSSPRRALSHVDRFAGPTAAARPRGRRRTREARHGARPRRTESRQRARGAQRRRRQGALVRGRHGDRRLRRLARAVLLELEPRPERRGLACAGDRAAAQAARAPCRRRRCSCSPTARAPAAP